MDIEEPTCSAVWNSDDEMWVVMRDDHGDMITAHTILDLSQKLNDYKQIFPMQLRYPGSVETVDCIH
jgi:hypothetical protein